MLNGLEGSFPSKFGPLQFRCVNNFTRERKRHVSRAFRRRQGSGQGYRVDEVAGGKDVSERRKSRRRPGSERRANASPQDLQQQSDTQ